MTTKKIAVATCDAYTVRCAYDKFYEDNKDVVPPSDYEPISNLGMDALGPNSKLSDVIHAYLSSVTDKRDNPRTKRNDYRYLGNLSKSIGHNLISNLSAKFLKSFFDKFESKNSANDHIKNLRKVMKWNGLTILRYMRVELMSNVVF